MLKYTLAWFMVKPKSTSFVTMSSDIATYPVCPLTAQ
jgi:hypothetical protein